MSHETVVNCFENPVPVFGPLEDMLFEPGNREDWDALHELHYKSTGKTNGRYYKVSLHGETIAVCVMTSPRGLLAPRHEMFPRLKPGKGETKMTNTYRYVWLNKNSCLNSRTVVDTMYRGIGVAYRLLNLAARAEGKRFAEIQSSMSRFNLFAQKAGFLFAKPKHGQHYEAGLQFFMLNFKSNPVDYVAIMDELNGHPEPVRDVMISRMREFYYQHSALEKTGKNRHKGTDRVDAMPQGELLKNIQQLVFAIPLYGVYENPDAGRELPKTLPLTAFDRQATNEPLILD